MFRCCAFAVLAALGLVVGAAAPSVGAAETRAATATYYVRYTQYAKYPDGTVRRVGGGTVGPYYTRRSAQSTCDWYNANDYYVGRVRYYYSARVI